MRRGLGLRRGPGMARVGQWFVVCTGPVQQQGVWPGMTDDRGRLLVDLERSGTSKAVELPSVFAFAMHRIPGQKGQGYQQRNASYASNYDVGVSKTLCKSWNLPEIQY